MSEFPNRFRQLKNASGVSSKELAKKLDIVPSTLSYYLNGREPSYDILINIANYFNVSVDWLIGNDVNLNNIEDERLNLISENRKLCKKLLGIKKYVNEELYELDI